MFHHLEISNTDSGLSFDIQLDPDKRLYCFVGDNGVGKTALLHGIGQICLFSHCMWRGGNRLGEGFHGLYRRNVIRDKFQTRSLRVPDAIWNQKPVKGGTSWGVATLVMPIGDLAQSPISIDRPVVFVCSHQRADISNIDPKSLALVGDAISSFCDTVDRQVAALMREPLNTATVSTWITARLLLNPNFVIGLAPIHFEVILLCELLQKFAPETFSNLVTRSGNETLLNVAYKDGALLFVGRPIHLLAHGWMALIKILQEIISSISAWEQMRGSNDVLNSDALIFIDEIDSHLHPKWQARLIRFLKEVFPHATFFLATHSPLLVRDTDPGEAYELVRDGSHVRAQRLGSPRDWYMTDIYAHAFHVDLTPPSTEGEQDLASMLLDYVVKVRSFTSSKEEAIKDEAISLYNSISPRLLAGDPRRTTLDQLRRMLG